MTLQGEPVEEHVWQHLSSILWEHINLVGRIMRTDVQLEEKFRPLRTVEERRAKRKKDTTPQKERGPIPSSDDEREKDPPIQLSV